MSPDQLLEAQRQHLRIWLPLIAQSIPFYRERLGEECLHKDFDLTWEAFRRFPLLTRTDLRGQGDRLQNPAPGPAFQPVSSTSTSGSTGQPITTWASHATGMLLNELRLRLIADNRLDPNRDAAFITTPLSSGAADPPEGKIAGPWAPPLGNGVGLILDLRADPNDQLAWLQRKAPSYLTTYPSNLLALLKLSERQGITLPHMQAVMLSSEPISDELRQLCRTQWGARCIGTYSASECGLMAMEVADEEGYVVQAENVLVEVLDEQGRLCGPGEVGRVVVTTLHDALRPLVRYEIGDYAEVGQLTTNSQGVARLRRIVGRQRTMVRLPDGRRVWPFFHLSSLVEVTALEQWQLLQKRDLSLEVRVVTRRPLEPEEEERVRRVVEEALPGLPITLRPVEEVERAPGGKYVELLSECDES